TTMYSWRQKFACELFAAVRGQAALFASRAATDPGNTWFVNCPILSADCNSAVIQSGSIGRLFVPDESATDRPLTENANRNAIPTTAITRVSTLGRHRPRTPSPAMPPPLVTRTTRIVRKCRHRSLLSHL